MKYYFNALRNIASQSLQILQIIALLSAEVVTIFEPKIQLWKNLQTLQVYIIYILQHLGTKYVAISLCSF